MPIAGNLAKCDLADLVQSIAMTLPRWDRIFYLSFLATVLAVLAYMVILFVPLISVSSSEFEGTEQRTLLADGQVTPLLLSLLPVLITAATLLAVPRYHQPDRAAKINLWLSTILVYAFVVISIWSVGILFVFSAILLTSAAVGAQVRRRGPRAQYVPDARSTQESKTGPGGGKRRRNKG